MTGRRRTLRGRVSLVATVVIAGWLAVLAVGFDVVLDNRLDAQIEGALRVRAQAASATLDLRAGRLLGVRESSNDSTLDNALWVYSSATVVHSARNATPDTDAAAARAAASPGHFLEHGDRRYYALPVRSGGRAVGTVVTSIDAAPYDHTERTVIVGTVVVALLLLAGAYPVLRIATARALRPVAAMTRQAAEWSVSEPARRFGSTAEPGSGVGGRRYAELDQLGRTLDELLDRLSAVVRHEYQLSAELSHDLRTPLARTVTSIDLLLDDAPPEHRADLEALRTTCMAMESTIDTIMATAQAELSGTVGRCRVDTALAGFTTDDSPAVTVDVAPAAGALSVGVDSPVLHRMLAPVVDNARRYARTEVQLAATRRDNVVIITVVDDGTPLAGEHADAVFEPGWRADPEDGHDGAGLGLALARRLARAADGELDVAAGAARTTFRLTLPAG